MARFRSVILSVLPVVGLLSGAASAQSAFDGAYAGVNVGYDWMQPQARTVGGNHGAGTTDGFVAGTFAGYGWTFAIPEVAANRFYLGGEAEASLYTADTDRDILGQASAAPDYSAGLSVRAGYLVTPETLGYVRVGWEHTGVSLTSNPIAPGLKGVQDYAGFDGVRAGGGVDYALSEHLFARVEYTYTGYFRTNVHSLGSAAAFEPNDHQMHVGFGYRF